MNKHPFNFSSLRSLVSELPVQEQQVLAFFIAFMLSCIIGSAFSQM